MNHQTILGFDFGTKRIGVAFGQAVTGTARPVTTLSAKDEPALYKAIQGLLETWQPQAMVVGMPLNMDGTEQEVTELAKAFSDQLRERFALPVYDIDERLSTIEARARVFEEGGYKALQETDIDAVAAQLIIETWFREA